MGMESGFSSPRTEAFPNGLRVLVVDDDPTWLKILEKMLKKCNYDVTTCGLAREALRLLRDREDGFDIVISDVNMPDMDGFKLLERVGLEMDLPVIMMSVDGETSRVMKGVQHGACDYLLKPIRMKELKNIWQHVVRKRLHEVRDIEFIEDRNGTDHSSDGYYGVDQTHLKKRKDVDNKHDEKESSDPSSTKKARVVWSVDLHQKFVKAVNQIGIDSDKVGPKKILDLMNVPWLTRENVASHLQKYRLYLSRIGKEDNTETPFVGAKNPDHSPRESSGSISVENSSFGQQKDVTSNYGTVQSVEVTLNNKDLKSKNENRKPVNNENSDPQRANFRSLETSFNYASYESPVCGRYPWSGEVSELQFKAETKPQLKLKDCLNQPMGSILQQQSQANVLEPGSHICPAPAPAPAPAPSISESDSFSLIDIKPPISKQTGKSIRQLSPMEGAFGSFSVRNTDAFGCVFDSLDVKDTNYSQDTTVTEHHPLQNPILTSHSKNHLSGSQGLQPIFDVSLEMNQSSTCQAGIVGQSSVNISETDLNYKALGRESPVGVLGEDQMFRWLQGGDVPTRGSGFDYVGLSDFNLPEQNEVPVTACVPKVGLEFEYPFDWVEYPIIDQGLLFS